MKTSQPTTPSTTLTSCSSSSGDGGSVPQEQVTTNHDDDDTSSLRSTSSRRRMSLSSLFTSKRRSSDDDDTSSLRSVSSRRRMSLSSLFTSKRRSSKRSSRRFSTSSLTRESSNSSHSHRQQVNKSNPEKNESGHQRQQAHRHSMPLSLHNSSVHSGASSILGDTHRRNSIGHVKQPQPTLGGKGKGSPIILDSYQVDNVLSTYSFPDADRVVDNIREEVSRSCGWAELVQKGKPLPRLVTVQGDVDDVLGIEPLYRDLHDYQPCLASWTPTIKALRDLVSNIVVQPLNHAIVCYYRHGEDYLSESSSPTLDLCSDSSIVKLSLGATRTMILRPKRKQGNVRRPSPRPTTKVVLPHGSLLCLGPKTNRFMTQEIKRISRFATPSPSPTNHNNHDNQSLVEDDDDKCHQMTQSVDGSIAILQTTTTTIQRDPLPGAVDSAAASVEHIRICITFRHVATFQTPEGKIFGKGAIAGTLTQTNHPNPYSSSKVLKMAAIQAMKGAFLLENRDTDFDRERYYSSGFDVVPFQYVTTMGPPDINDDDEVGEGDCETAMISDSRACEKVTANNAGLSVATSVSEDDDISCRSAATRTTTSECRGLSLKKNKQVEHLRKSRRRTVERRRSTNTVGDSQYYHNKSISRKWHSDHHAKDGDDDSSEAKYIPYSQDIFVKRQIQTYDMIPDLNASETQTFSDSSMSGAFVDDQQQLLLTPCTSSATSPKISPLSTPRSCSPRSNGIALLVLDLQNDFLSDDPSFFFGKLGSPFATRRSGLLKRISELANEVRRKGGVVFMVKSQYGAWSSPQNKKFRRRRSEPGAHMDRVDCCRVNSAGADFHPDVEMMIVKQDIILIKEWHSAFMGTTLDGQLQKLKIGHVVVCGVTTDHSVAATVRSAANLGYNVILSSDGTAQVDGKMQKKTVRSLEKYCSAILRRGQKLSQVVTLDPFLDSLFTKEGGKPTESLEIDALSRMSGFGAGDSIIVPDFLDMTSAAELLAKMLPNASNELEWSEVAGNFGSSLTAAYHIEPNDQGHLPVYRSNVPQPWDRNFKAGTFPESVQKLKALTESQTGHKLNWGQVLCYRNGTEGSGWDADKNLDVRAGSTIAAVSLGGDRVLELKPKKSDSSLLPQRIRLEHNSLLLLGPETTRLFLHSLPPADDESPDPHIHVTFLDVATFFSKSESRMGVPALYGQGTEYSSHAELQQAEAARRMMEQCGMALAGVYTLSTLPPGRGGSLGLTFFCTIAVAAGTAAWFQSERQNAWRERQRRLFKLFEDCTEEPLSVEEARHRILSRSK
ncbi:hypothetical protein ACA910_012594 [Epithemia clementina (nom. ined.)]